MAAPKLQYHFYDFVTGLYNATLPCQGVQFGSALNFNSAQLSGFIPLTEPEVRALDPWDATTPGMSVVVVDLEVDGEHTLVEAYVIWQRDRKKSKQGITFTGQTVLSWFNQRAQATDYSNPPESGITPVDPMTYWNQAPADPTLIAAQLLSDALAVYRFNQVTTGMDVFGGLGILINGLPPNAAAPVTPSDAWQSPTYQYGSMQTLSTIFGQLTALGWLTGFDMRANVAWSNGPRSPLIGTIEIGYPRLGRTAAESGLVIDANQCRDYDFGEDASKSGSTLYESGISNTLYTEDNVLPRVQGWPLLEQIISRSSTNAQTTASTSLYTMLAAIANSDAYLLSYPVCSPVVTMPLWGIDPELGSFIAGDDARVRMGPDLNFPDGFEDDFRIVSWNATPKDAGDSTIDYTLNVPPGGAATGPTV